MPLTSEELSANRDFLTVSRELLRAAVFEGRPPGTTGRVLAFSGSDAEGRVVALARKGQLWELQAPEEEAHEIALDEVIRRLGKGSLQLDGMTVVPDIADYLFKHAVEQAEDSLKKYLEAEAELARLLEAADEGEEAVRFALHAGALDRSVARAVTSIVLAIATVEAQLNKWAEERGGWRKRGKMNEERLPAHEKCRALATRAHATIDLGESPWSDLRDAVEARKSIIHSNPMTKVVLLSVAAHRVPGYEQSLEARRACWAVRQSMVALAAILRTDPGSYLAYCPPGPAEDDDAWRNASVMTGMRADPDFPPLSERL